MMACLDRLALHIFEKLYPALTLRGGRGRILSPIRDCTAIKSCLSASKMTEPHMVNKVFGLFPNIPMLRRKPFHRKFWTYTWIRKKINKKNKKEEINRKAYGCISQISMVLWIRSSGTQPHRLVEIWDFSHRSWMRDISRFDRLWGFNAVGYLDPF
jgi:hypothetical protein